MQVLSEAVPLTDGEVYALIRRRRDERNAARHPPLGLQPVLADGHPPPPLQSQRAVVPNSAASALSGISAGVGGTTSTSVRSRAVPVDMLDSVAAAAAASTASLLAAPSSRHLLVLLTEVTMLNYLANHASLLHDTSGSSNSRAAGKATYTLRDVYGPTSVYDKGVTEATALPVSLMESTAATSGTVEGNVLTDTAQVASCYAALAAHRPGTKGHVKAVSDLLDQYDDAGRAQERIYAAGIRRVYQQLMSTLHTNVPAVAGSLPLPPVKPEKTEEGEDRNTGDQRSRNEESKSGTYVETLSAKKMLNEAAAVDCGGSSNTCASVPLLLEPSPLWGPAGHNTCPPSTGAAAGETMTSAVASSSSPHHHPAQGQACRPLLSSSEVLQLVVGRPQRPLDVYRLLDDLDGRLQYQEEAITAFVEGVTAVFQM
jgi:hypothetical protein